MVYRNRMTVKYIGAKAGAAGGFHYYRTRSLTGYSRLILAPVKCWWLSAIKGELWAPANRPLPR